MRSRCREEELEKAEEVEESLLEGVEGPTSEPRKGIPVDALLLLDLCVSFPDDLVRDEV